jgi:hypothetical protein
MTGREGTEREGRAGSEGSEGTREGGVTSSPRLEVGMGRGMKREWL